MRNYDLERIVELAKEIYDGDTYGGPLDVKLQLIEALAERLDERLAS